MRYILSGLRLPFAAGEEEALSAARRALSLPGSTMAAVHKRSFDLRHGTLTGVWSVELTVSDENTLPDRPDLRPRPEPFLPEPSGTKQLSSPPVIVGFGPAGLFAALALAKRGYRPLVLERGPSLSARDRAVSAFFETGALDTHANIQFGEGGAGAYSDGKLTTRVGDPRGELVFEWLRQHGAPEDSLRLARPHVGTDLLKNVVSSIREEILRLGGQVCFNCAVTGLAAESGYLTALHTDQGMVPADVAVLAIGHSARDSFEMLRAQGVAMEQKPFSVGLRIEHRQLDIDDSLYGHFCGTPGLPPGEYVLSAQTALRKCYTFCMCPGGRVIAAASEPFGVVTNGMSDHARNGQNANSALCVPVESEDFESRDPLAGVAFQRRLERAAFVAGGGGFQAPAQTVGDFLVGRKTISFGHVLPSYPRGVTGAELGALLPVSVRDSLRQALPVLAGKLRAFGDPEAVLTGIETRTSSPVRILRGEDLGSPSVLGLIPCGEGAGYAGGIVSAAVDGLRAAEQIMEQYKPFE
ncbi:MAG: hypothetical protein VB086_06260 [Clostridiaceae bacterium]|nr:hypothetical protein [Clostridiaceae bacterium]